MRNMELRMMIAEKHIYFSQIARELGISVVDVRQMLEEPLDSEDKEKLLEVIIKLDRHDADKTNDGFTRRRALTPARARNILMESNQTQFDLIDVVCSEWLGARALEREIPRARFQYRCGKCDLDISETDWGDEDSTLKDFDNQFNYCPRCGQRIDWDHDVLFDRIHVMQPSRFENAARLEEKRKKLEDDKDYWAAQDIIFGLPDWYFNHKDIWDSKAYWMEALDR